MRERFLISVDDRSLEAFLISTCTGCEVFHVLRVPYQTYGTRAFVRFDPQYHTDKAVASRYAENLHRRGGTQRL